MIQPEYLLVRLSLAMQASTFKSEIYDDKNKSLSIDRQISFGPSGIFHLDGMRGS